MKNHTLNNLQHENLSLAMQAQAILLQFDYGAAPNQCGSENAMHLLETVRSLNQKIIENTHKSLDMVDCHIKPRPSSLRHFHQVNS